MEPYGPQGQQASGLTSSQTASAMGEEWTPVVNKKSVKLNRGIQLPPHLPHVHSLTPLPGPKPRTHQHSVRMCKHSRSGRPIAPIVGTQ